MGSDSRGSVLLSGAVRVVPDVPSFSVDDGFAYSVPDGLELSVGSMVRVPLGGRRVRGWVVATEPESDRRLKAVVSRSGDVPVFDDRLLQVLRWAAAHYVAPLSALLGKATPPNLPRGAAGAAVGVGRRRRVELVSGPGPWADLAVELAHDAGEEDRSTLIVAPTVVEAEGLAETLRERFGARVALAGSAVSARESTAAWMQLAGGGPAIVVGTRETAAWPIGSPGRVLVVGEGRRGMKDKATPTVHARDLLLRRALVERLPLVLAGTVPTPEALERARDVRVHARPWGLVEVVDRSDEPPGKGLLAAATQAALRAAEGRVLLFTHRRTAAQRCVRCRSLRRCERCGASPGDAEACRRCGAAARACPECGGRRFETLGAPVSRLIAEAGRLLDGSEVGQVGSGARVVAGTERDLPGLEVDLTIVVDGDGPLMSPSYRAGEEGLRLIGRAIAAAGSGRGRRGMVQTADPGQPAMQALLRADPGPFIRAEARSRRELGFPPGGEVLALEARGVDPVEASEELEGEVGDRAEIHGPAQLENGTRWLLQGPDLGRARVVLRGVVGRWRDAGARVRVDADPIDL